MLCHSVQPLIDRHEVSRYLPHRVPMILVDRLLTIVDGKTIGEFTVHSQNPFVNAHGEMVLGGVVEHMAQTSGLGQAYESSLLNGAREASLSEEGEFGFIINIRALKFSRLPHVGETIRTESFTATHHGNHSTASFTCFAGEEQIMTCIMGLMAPGNN
jgi:predicted hotdog family 3-hydroxylacyl-ACP dehydratase